MVQCSVINLIYYVLFSCTDYFEWACVAGFLHLLWAMTYFPYILDNLGTVFIIYFCSCSLSDI